MKTIKQINKACLRAQMRVYALEYRRAVHPGHQWWGDFPTRMEVAVAYIRAAVAYRKLSEFIEIL